jgi:hypothetical protein
MEYCEDRSISQSFHLNFSAALSVGGAVSATADLALGQRLGCNASTYDGLLAAQRRAELLKPFTVLVEATNVTRTFTLSEQQVTFAVEQMRLSELPSALDTPPATEQRKADFIDCVCKGGCNDPRFAFSGLMDEFRVYSTIKVRTRVREMLTLQSPNEMLFESKFSSRQPDNCPVCNARRQEEFFRNLYVYYHFDEIETEKVGRLLPV